MKIFQTGGSERLRNLGSVRGEDGPEDSDGEQLEDCPLPRLRPLLRPLPPPLSSTHCVLTEGAGAQQQFILPSPFPGVCCQS